MAYVIINNNKYDIPEIDFDAICELEENGVNLLQMDRENIKPLSMTRGLAAFVMGCNTKTASRELEAHIQNGGDIADIFDRVIDAINNSGFFKQGGKKQPQDNQDKQGKVQQYPDNQNQQPQNRAQRRRNKNRGNGNR